MALILFSVLLLVATACWAQVDDIFNDPVERYEMGHVDMILTKQQERALRSRSAYLNIRKWPNGVIPYIVDARFQAIPSRMAALKQAIQDYNDNTCIRLVPRTNQSDYVRFINGGGCYSNLGVVGGVQDISYGNGCDTTRGTPVHEIMHCLGFMHEQQRPDRDNYVTVNMQYVTSGTENNFQKASYQETDLANTGNYDVMSVMHYPAWAFTNDWNQHTIVPKDASLLDKIGQRNFFSPCDLAKINKFYKCAGYKTTC